MPSIIPPATPEPSRREELRDDLVALLEMTLSPRDASDAVDTLDELIRETRNEDIEAARREYLTDATGTPEDEAYQQAVADVIGAIDALRDATKRGAS